MWSCACSIVVLTVFVLALTCKMEYTFSDTNLMACSWTNCVLLSREFEGNDLFLGPTIRHLSRKE